MKNRRSGFFGYKENSRTSIYKHTQTRRNGFLLKSKNFFSAMQGLLLCHSKRPCNYTFSAYLQGLLKSGPEGNRTPVRKSIPCSSTIIVPYLTFPLPSGKKHSDGFSSFIIRPHVQSFTCVVSYIVDARVLKCRCLKSDSCH